MSKAVARKPGTRAGRRAIVNSPSSTWDAKVVRVESDDARLALRGVETSEASADLIVVNTCTVTGGGRPAGRAPRPARERPCPRAGHRLRRHRTAFYEGARRARERVVGPQLAQAIVPCSTSAFSPGEDAPLHIGSGFHARVGVKVQDGCDNACTYCIVHVSTRRATNRPADDVVRECVYARAGAGDRAHGINLGSYCDGQRDPPRSGWPLCCDACSTRRPTCTRPARYRRASACPVSSRAMWTMRHRPSGFGGQPRLPSSAPAVAGGKLKVLRG